MITIERLSDQVVGRLRHKLNGDGLICIGLFGSWARGEQNLGSDVDVFVVTSRSLRVDRRQEISDTLKDIAEEYDLYYDATFPVEAIYKYDLQLALNGYGFIVDNGYVVIDTIGPSDWTPFNEYRQWLSVFATPTVFLAGDIDAYSQFVAHARKTMLRIAISAIESSCFSDSDLDRIMVRDGKESLGFVDSAFTRRYIRDVYGKHLMEFCEDGYLDCSNGKYRILDRQKILPPAVKPKAQFELESRYLGIHDNGHTIGEMLNTVGRNTAKFLNGMPLDYLSHERLREIASNISVTGGDSEDLWDVLLQFSVKQNHPRYMAFPDAGNAKSAIVGAWLEPILNQNMIAVDKSAPLATFIEAELISHLRKLVGYQVRQHSSALDLGGIATNGGVGSNTVALLVARSRTFPEMREHGMEGINTVPYLLISDRTLEHYSHGAAFWWLGMGERNVVPVRSSRFQFDTEDLHAKLQYYNQGNRRVMAVVAVAGDSRTLTIQELSSIEPMTRAHDVWLHLDACHGGIGLFSSDREQLCADFGLADSISLDPHKGLALPYALSYCLFKDPTALQAISKSTDITISRGTYDMGQVTAFLGSRPFGSVKLWSLLTNKAQEIERAIDYRIRLAHDWAEMLAGSRYFTPMHRPQLTAVAFSVDPHKVGKSDVGHINRKVHDAVYREGWAIIHTFDLVDFNSSLGLGENAALPCLGVNFGNVQLDRHILEVVLRYLEDVASEILAHG